jgi:hypothetical protein
VLLLIVGPNAADVPFPLFFGLLGFIAGVAFSGVLGLVEGRRRFEQLSLPRVATWGAVGGLLLAAGMIPAAGPGSFPVLGVVFALSSATCAAGSLTLARRGSRRDALVAGASPDDPRLAGGPEGD